MLHDFEIEELNSDVSITQRRWHGYLNIPVPVLWNGNVYIINSAAEEHKQCKLLKYSISGDSWSDYVLPCDVKMRRWNDCQQVHALTTYDSKLLLINGTDNYLLQSVDITESSFKVFEFDATTSTFKPSPDITPPQSMRIQGLEHMHEYAAASEGKYLLICRKSGFLHGWCCEDIIIYMYDGSTWVLRDGPCLYGESSYQLLFHNRSVFLVERFHTIYGNDLSHIYETSLQSLIDNDPDPWQLLKSTLPSSGRTCNSNFIVLESHLSLVSCSHPEFRVCNYSVNSESWQEAGRITMPSISFNMDSLCVVTLPDRNLMTICSGDIPRSEVAVYKLTPKSEVYVLLRFTVSH